MRFFAPAVEPKAIILSPKQRCLQAFLSQAVADAFCYPFEFGRPKLEDIEAHWRSRSKIYITDDTQMAMFGLYGLAEGIRNNKPVFEPQLYADFLLPAYLAWYRTQHNDPVVGNNWLESRREMRKTQAPGSTCLNSLQQWKWGVRPKTLSKGTGAVMRSLPFVFMKDLGTEYYFYNEHTVATMAGRLTHGHPESDEAVGLYMAVAKTMLNLDHEPPALIAYLDSILADYKVQKLANMDQIQKKYGDTFTALPAMLAAVVTLRNALKKDDFKIILTECSINNGDSDTVAAIVGGLWGLTKPAPKTLINRLAERQLIEELIDWSFALAPV